MNRYATKRSDLLGGVASVLTGGKVRRVDLERGADTGRAEFKGDECRRIVLPDEDSLPEGFTLDAARGLLDHEMAHALYTTNGPGVPKNGTLHHQITNILEDARIEALMGERFPGAKLNIAELNRVGLAIQREAVAKAEGPLNPLMAVLLGVMLMSHGEAPDALLADQPGADALLALLAKAQPHVGKAIKAKGTAAVAKEAKAILDLFATPPPLPPPPSGQGAPQEGECEGEGQAQPGKGQGKAGADKPEGKDAQDGPEAEGLNAAEGKAAQDGPEAEGPDAAEGKDAQDGPEAEGPDEGEGKDAQDGPEAEAQAVLAALADMTAKGDPAAQVQAIADAVAEALMEALDEAEKAVREKEAMELLEAKRTGLVVPIYPVAPEVLVLDTENAVKPTDGLRETYQQRVDALRPTIMGLRSALRIHLLSEGRGSMRQEQEQGILSSKTLYQVAQGTGTRVFQTTRHGKTRQTLVTLLVDGSGSMGGQKVLAARDTAIALAEALRGMPGIKTEILGFRTVNGTDAIGRTHALQHSVFKTFASADASPSAAITSGGCNADGESLRWAARRMLAQRGDRRILVVLSDGQPSFSLNGYSDSHAEADLRAAVDAVERAGIETVGIGIMDRSVCGYYPKNVVINAPADLAGGTLRQLTTLLMPPKRDEARRLAAQAGRG